MCSQSCGTLRSILMLVNSAARRALFICELGNVDVSNHTSGLNSVDSLLQNKCSITCPSQWVTVMCTKAFLQKSCFICVSQGFFLWLKLNAQVSVEWFCCSLTQGPDGWWMDDPPQESQQKQKSFWSYYIVLCLRSSLNFSHDQHFPTKQVVFCHVE